MATQIYFNNKVRKLPGAYSTITSGEQSTPQNLDYGKVLIIDTGLGATFGGGSGSNGALASGKDAVYQFTNVDDFKSFVKGGMFWKLAEALFSPYRNYPGVSTLYFARAAETAAATMTMTVTKESAGGTFKIKCKDEGLIGNGALTSTHLDKGYAFTVSAGTVDTTKFVFKVWQGQWKGNHTDGIAYDEIAKDKANAVLVLQSPEFNNIQTLINWANTDKAFGRKFVLDSTSAVVGTGVVETADISTFATYVVATGGTETYGTADLTKVFDSVGELDYQFLLSDEIVAADYDTTPTTSIISHITSADTDFIKTLVIGGEADEDAFDDSLAMAVDLDSNRAIVVHGAVKQTSKSLSNGYRVWPPVYHAAMVLGRICGLQPQVPVTNKQIGIDGVVHNLTKKEQEQALDSGLLVTVNDQFRGGFKVLQGVNTLQDNKELFNELGQSFSVQFERITAQINRELIINSETDLLNQENGVNVNTLSPGLLKSWTETYLMSRVANVDTDNLLLSFRNVTVTRVDDYYKVTYGIVVNNEITKIFYTGFLFRS
jgi:hypothetical protein